MVEEPNTFIEADDHDDDDGAANAMFDLVDNEDLAEGKEENIQKLKLKIKAMQKANWRLRKQKEMLRNQLDNAVSVVQMYCVLIH
jgi:predicted RNase H-like nuclease (RuvC/YqgF family)